MLTVHNRGRTSWTMNYKPLSAIPRIIKNIEYKGVKCSHSFKWLTKLIIIINIYCTMSKCAYNTTKEVIQRINFDSDDIPFVIDNSANCYICMDNLYFKELHLFTPREKEILGSIGMIGDGATPEGFGNIRLVWKDNNRIDHEYLVENVFCVPNSPINLLEVTKFGK